MVQSRKKSAVKKKSATTKKSTSLKKGDKVPFTVLLGGKRKSRTVKAEISGFKTHKRADGRTTRIAYADNPIQNVGGGKKVYRIVPAK